MTFDDSDVAHVAMLARLGLSDAERTQFGEQLRAILDHVSMLQSVDTSHLAATARVGDVVNAWREDASRASISSDAALGDAPERDGDYFVVGAIQE
jgi:aspartyl-tRNA(Asn)/glutamyl-tRNA(Gln) amidotransferase subunit C